jgi:hypothetical protein
MLAFLLLIFLMNGTALHSFFYLIFSSITYYFESRNFTKLLVLGQVKNSFREQLEEEVSCTK